MQLSYRPCFTLRLNYSFKLWHPNNKMVTEKENESIADARCVCEGTRHARIDLSRKRTLLQSDDSLLIAASLSERFGTWPQYSLRFCWSVRSWISSIFCSTKENFKQGFKSFFLSIKLSHTHTHFYQGSEKLVLVDKLPIHIIFHTVYYNNKE